MLGPNHRTSFCIFLLILTVSLGFQNNELEIGLQENDLEIYRGQMSAEIWNQSAWNYFEKYIINEHPVRDFKPDSGSPFVSTIVVQIFSFHLFPNFFIQKFVKNAT